VPNLLTGLEGRDRGCAQRCHQHEANPPGCNPGCAFGLAGEVRNCRTCGLDGSPLDKGNQQTSLRACSSSVPSPDDPVHGVRRYVWLPAATVITQHVRTPGVDVTRSEARHVAQRRRTSSMRTGGRRNFFRPRVDALRRSRFGGRFRRRERHFRNEDTSLVGQVSDADLATMSPDALTRERDRTSWRRGRASARLYSRARPDYQFRYNGQVALRAVQSCTPPGSGWPDSGGLSREPRIVISAVSTAPTGMTPGTPRSP